jgi:hypothetical protein
MKTDITNSKNILERQKRIQQNKDTESPIIEELNKAGFSIHWISDLHYIGSKYYGALPILAKWLPLIDNTDVKESIVRVLSIPWATSSIANFLLQEFVNTANDIETLKWAIANALSIISDKTTLEPIIKLVKDKNHGHARQMLTIALGNIRDIRAEPVLIDLLDDEVCVGHALISLRKLKSKRALSKIAQLTEHSNPWIRKEAKKTILTLTKTSKG